MKKITKVLIGTVAVLMFTSSVYAQYQQNAPYRMLQKHQQEKEEIFKELNLTPEQHEKLKQNRTAQQEKISALRTKIKEAWLKLREELKKPDSTKATVTPFVSEIKSLHPQIIDARIDGILAVKSILTPQQYAKFQEIISQRQQKRKEGGFHGRQRFMPRGQAQGAPGSESFDLGE